MLQTIDVELKDRSYRIEIDQSLFYRTGIALQSQGNVSRIALITDDLVEPLYSHVVTENILECGLDVDVFVVPAGEESKSLDVAQELWKSFLEADVTRQTVVVALGGGVVGDLAGFIAATYMRGLRFFQIPTTLLAQVDSSVGGKVGVNFLQTKNLLGAFHQPLGVLIDPLTLKTLSDRQYRAGLGEVVKYAFSLDSAFQQFLEAHVDEINKRDLDVLSSIILRCCQLKAEIVAQDEFETSGLRALLNYGHTFAHAIESSATPGQILHGEAVSAGLVFAAKLAEKQTTFVPDLFHFHADDVSRQLELLKKLQLPTSLDDLVALNPLLKKDVFESENLLRFMNRDKKNEKGHCCFVLPTEPGRCQRFFDIPQDRVREIFNEMS